MRIFFILIFSLIFSSLFSQLNGSVKLFYSNLHDCEPTEYLFSKINTTDVSIAYSLRKLNGSYTGNCMRIRRSTDNVETDIPFTSQGFIDTNFFKTFVSGGNGYVVKWYDQSGLGRDAEQTINTSQQPEFQLSSFNNKPAIYFDGANDNLRISTSIQILTTNGLDGSLFLHANITTRNQTCFGIFSGGDRWSIHLNWGDGKIYFDPGFCCNANRSASNSSGILDFHQYSFLRGANVGLIKKDGVTLLNATYTATACTKTYGPTIGAGASAATTQGSYAKIRYQELMMFKTQITGTDLNTIEQDQTNYW